MPSQTPGTEPGTRSTSTANGTASGTATVTGTETAIVDFCLLKFDEILTLMRDLDPATANRRPPVPGIHPPPNSPYALLTHCLGMMRRWSSTVVLGEAVPRDREAEFSATGDLAELLSRAATVRAEFVTDAARTNFSVPPVAPPEDRSEAWAGSTAGIYLHILEELSQHLGHLELTLDLLAAHPETDRETPGET